jgi:hypothetical protein
VVRREAEVTLSVDVVERVAARPIYHDQVAVDLVSGSILALDTGIFASPADLQALAQQALGQAIDQLLDKPGFIAAIYAGGSPLNAAPVM